jgi:Na+/glutamate symporter
MIPDGVRCIGHDAFSQCSSLKSVRIPSSVVSGLGAGVFFGCLLKDITFDFSIDQIPPNYVGTQDFLKDLLGRMPGCRARFASGEVFVCNATGGW